MSLFDSRLLPTHSSTARAIDVVIALLLVVIAIELVVLVIRG